MAVFIDGSNLTSWAGKNDRVNFEALLRYFYKRGKLVVVYIYLPARSVNFNEQDPEKLAEIKKRAAAEQGWHNHLRRLGYRVKTRTLRPTRSSGEIIGYKANLDVEIAVDMTLTALNGRVDEVYLISGDSDFEYPLRMIRDSLQAVRTILVAPYGQTAQELLRAVDEVIWLKKEEELGKEILEQKAGEEPSVHAEEGLDEPEIPEL